MTRVEAREFMMQVFFQMEACGDFDVNSRADFMNQEKIRDQSGSPPDPLSLGYKSSEDNLTHPTSHYTRIKNLT